MRACAWAQRAAEPRAVIKPISSSLETNSSSALACMPLDEKQSRDLRRCTSPRSEATRRSRRRALLQAGARVDAVNDDGETALQLAMKGGHAQVARLLREAASNRQPPTAAAPRRTVAPNAAQAPPPDAARAPAPAAPQRTCDAPLFLSARSHNVARATPVASLARASSAGLACGRATAPRPARPPLGARGTASSASSSSGGLARERRRRRAQA